jgi:hypothetical protein
MEAAGFSETSISLQCVLYRSALMKLIFVLHDSCPDVELIQQVTLLQYSVSIHYRGHVVCHFTGQFFLFILVNWQTVERNSVTALPTARSAGHKSQLRMKHSVKELGQRFL